MRQITGIASILVFNFLLVASAQAQPLNQKKGFTHADTLRGSLRPERTSWEVLKYDITVKPDYTSKTIAGKNIISLFDKGVYIMQIDLQEPMILDSVTENKNSFSFRREGNVYWVELRDPAKKYKIKPGPRSLAFYFHGKPREAVRPPWDGGWIWRKSKDGSPWMSVACQGLGASVWYPCKDHQSDEPDSAALHMVVPDSLTAVGNGRFRGKQANGDGTSTYSWAVTNPINNYNIIPYIGKYVHFGEVYPGEKGKLDMDYWVLQENLDKAKEQFKDAPRMMKAFEHWFGPYPFYEDGYKLVEAPHLGMEHQSATAYGNGYRNGYRGSDLSGSGWGLKWDFIIVHESGHEWFANNITSKDIADMWIHESFTNYSETLFTDYFYGKEAGNAYVQGTRKNITNDIPIIGAYNVNQEGSGDMYYKGGNMLHTIRQVVNDDEKFRQILRGLNKTFYHQTVTTQQVETYISKESRIDFSKVFDQYLRTTQIPVLEYKVEGNKLSYRYTSCVPGFNMPLKVTFKTVQWIKPTEEWKTLDLYPEGDNSFTVDSNFYIKTKKTE
ncbi:MAG TPA: M1 family metallopeptidase [Ferruginibacter sp.]|nr:peptidase M1 [Chitinophagaceae bacterium]HRI24904.1 M1 family metallopeptidase [Ferruginibacter sp.]